eukprot:3681855-Ditylum_brightwellii.AAC.1
MEECNITMTCSKGCMHNKCKEGSRNSKRVIFCSNKTKSCGFLSDSKKDLNTIINKKITGAISCQEKKGKATVNKFKALSV